ncbi:transporter (formate/nitrite transporter family protein) [Sphingobium sp. TCM1]|jgi:formate/nitrite transporter FocA (FNT family)|nr:transporter (formate/nitrite transporter family protein) [Sphingobium sp. TCM1]
MDDHLKPDHALSADEARDVNQRRASSPMVVHEVVRLQGEEELKRPILSMVLSGMAAGLAINASLLTELYLRMRLPDTRWAELIFLAGYPVGYVIVIMGRLQLFTESTITAVLPVAAHPDWENLGRLLRLWSTVLLANLLGVVIVAALMANEVIITHDQRLIALDILEKLPRQEGLQTLTLGIPAGFLMAAIAWILPSAKGSEFWVISMLTYVIALGGFSHVVTGSSQSAFLWLNGVMSLTEMMADFILPALVGNVIGGTGLFAVLAHGQMRSDVKAAEQDADAAPPS